MNLLVDLSREKLYKLKWSEISLCLSGINPTGGTVMARKTNIESPPADSLPGKSEAGSWKRIYRIELLTPMAGGSTRSWQSDPEYPVRAQSVKGHLRFWWRTMQPGKLSPADLKLREGELWGSTDRASKVRISVSYPDDRQLDSIVLERNERDYVDYADFPGYVLFPLQGQTDTRSFTLIKHCIFTLTVSCPEKHRETVEATVKLWLLFGGIGARTRRGCGSLHCQEVMEEFPSRESIVSYLSGYISVAGGIGESPYPRLGGARIAFNDIHPGAEPLAAWAKYLERYGGFRQGRGIARNHGSGPRPGRTRWPEADAIRTLSGAAAPNHNPEHPAGIWFPRGAYGLPIQTEFRGARGDPEDKYFLEPASENNDRWPSPVILKIVRLGSGELKEICLILNSSVPRKLALTRKVGGRRKREVWHPLLPEEMPLASKGKKMPDDKPMRTGENPYDALIRILGLQESELTREQE